MEARWGSGDEWIGFAGGPEWSTEARWWSCDGLAGPDRGLLVIRLWLSGSPAVV